MADHNHDDAIVPAEPSGGVIRFFQTADLAGQPAPVETTREVHYEGLRSLSETVMDVLRPLSPRETEHPDAFWYTDAASGTGWLRLEGFPAVNLDEVQQAVRTLAIEAALGQPEPVRQEVLSVGNSVVNRTTNPYFKIAAGVVLLALAVFAMLRMLATPGAEAGKMFALVASIALAVVCVILIVNGLKRRAWWHRARAEAKRQGVPLPDRLKMWN